MKEAIIDETTIDVTGKDQGSNLEDGIEPEAGSGEDVPFDKNPRWIKMSEKGQAIDNILESHGFDSMEELQESLTDSTLLKESLGDVDPEIVAALKEKADMLDQYNAYWASQKEQARLEELDPDDRVRELEEENRRLQSQRQFDEAQRNQAINADNTLKNYEKGISASIKNDKTIPDFAKPFMSKYLGANHPMNAIDDDNLANPKEIEKMTGIAAKDVTALIDASVQAYRDGKLKAPDITPVQSSPVTGDKKIKNIKEADKAFMEILALKSKK